MNYKELLIWAKDLIKSVIDELNNEVHINKLNHAIKRIDEVINGG